MCISCKVNKGPAYRKDHSCVVYTIYWKWLSVQAEIKWSLKMTNRFRPVCCTVRRNQRELQLRTYQYQKQHCGGFWVSVWCLNHTASKWYNNCQMKITATLSPLTLRPVIFFFRGYVKDRVFVPPLPRDLIDLMAWINAAVKNIDAPMLTCVWRELEYCINVCHITRGAHIEHL